MANLDLSPDKRHAAIAGNAPAPSLALRIGLWAAQGFVALAFIPIGVGKLTTPIPKLAAMLPWTGEYPEAFVRFLGVVDIAGGVGHLASGTYTHQTATHRACGAGVHALADFAP